MKIIHNVIVHNVIGAGCLALTLGAASLHAQNVGINTANPLAKLTVIGSLAVGDNSFNVALPSANSSTNADWTNNEAIFQGAVGIGTTNPTQFGRLTVLNDGGGSDQHDDIALVSYGGAASPGPIFSFYGARGTAASPSTLVQGDLVGGITWWNMNAANPLGSISDTFTGTAAAPSDTVQIFARGSTAQDGHPNAAANIFLVGATGNVGINQSSPRAPLDVVGWSDIVDTATQVFFNWGSAAFGGPIPETNQAQVADAIFGHNVWCAESFISYTGTITLSDARLKNVIGRSDSGKDLATLENIEVTDYTMKDVVKYGSKPFKKVIAQQVEKVYPTAVTATGVKGLTFTPDVYAVSDSIKTVRPGVYAISLAKAHDLKDGDTVRLITLKNPELTVMAHVQNDKSFTVETKESLGEKVFVYGKQCLDLKAVDYEAISMLNVSATQELAKKVDALEKENSDFQDRAKRLTAVEEQDRGTISKQAQQIAEQDSKIAALEGANVMLRSEVAQLKAANERFTALAAQMEELKKAVTNVQEKEKGKVRTVSLEQ
jgi:Chaperone of endosialidase